jgi:hypothetical protein
MASTVLDYPPTAEKLKFAEAYASGAEISESDNLLPVSTRLRDYSTTASSPSDPQATAPMSEKLPPARPIIRPRHSAKPRKFDLMQQWEGVVTEIEAETFWAELRDLTEPTSNREVVEIYLREVAEQDKVLLAPGAVFYWSVGYDTSRPGTQVRASEIKFRRTPRWSKRRLEKIRIEGKLMAEKFLNVQQSEQSTTAG